MGRNKKKIILGCVYIKYSNLQETLQSCITCTTKKLINSNEIIDEKYYVGNVR